MTKRLIGIRMTEEQKSALEQAAKADGRSVSAYAVQAIEAYIQAEAQKAEVLDRIQDGLLDALASVAKQKSTSIAEQVKAGVIDE